MNSSEHRRSQRAPANSSYWILSAFTVACAVALWRPPPGLPTLRRAPAPACPVPVEVPAQGIRCLSAAQARQRGLFPGAVWMRGPHGEPVHGPLMRMAPRRLLLAQVRLDLATATTDELEALPDIGPHLAARIIAARDARAAAGGPPLRTRADLLQIAGIGERKLERLLPFLNLLP